MGFLGVFLTVCTLCAALEPPKALAPPVEKDGWVMPAPGPASEPVWGVKGGIMVGLWPTPGPRGLIRIYTPYLGQEPRQPLNFVAVEPIVGGRRGFSEMEKSDLDGVQGKRMWVTAGLEEQPFPRLPWQPPEIGVTKLDGRDVLTFRVGVEPFANGARPQIQVILSKDRPFEVAFRTYAAKDSASMEECVLSATMGNYARLRRIWLKNGPVDAALLWPKDTAMANGFEPHKQWLIDELPLSGIEVVCAATPDEANPAEAAYAEGTPPWWRYRGQVATQYWKTRVQDHVVARANGRRTYWSTNIPIPGGIAFENLEIGAPYVSGQQFVFGATTQSPATIEATRGAR